VAFSPLSLENNPENTNIFAEYTQRERFHRLFTHGWDFILKETTKSTWKTVKKFKLTEQKCWYKYTDPQQIIGLRFGKETKYGLYDIDTGSNHDPREQEESLNSLKEQLEEWGIVSFVLLQSSESQGLHLYFFLDRPINTFRLACVMNKAAVDAGIEIKRGQLETFPNTKSYNSRFNGHRLPLQQGSYLLDKDYTPYSDRLQDFLSAADWSAARNDTDLLESRLESAYEWYKAQKNDVRLQKADEQERIYNPTPEDREFIEQVDYAQKEIKEGFLNQIRIAIEQGFIGEGETNELLLTIAKLGRIYYGLTGQTYIDYIKETVMACPGYLKYCRHQREITRRCAEVARYGEKQWYPYRSSMPENRATYKYIKNSITNQTNLNLEKQHNAQSRIKQAVAKIEQQSVKLPNKVGECKLVIRNVTKELFGISVSDATLSKPENLPLWHPKYRLIECEELAATEAPQPEPQIEVRQKALQPEQPNNEQSNNRATPLRVIRKNDQNQEPLKAIPSIESGISCHTLPYMKGMIQESLIRFWYYTLQRAYCEALIKKRNLVLNFQSYQGNSVVGLVQRKGSKISKIASILSNSEVSVQRNQLHSTYYRDYPNQILVYIKPLVGAEDWRGSIPVPLELLDPLRIEKKKKKENHPQDPTKDPM
jgi:hypothetical protein